MTAGGEPTVSPAPTPARTIDRWTQADRVNTSYFNYDESTVSVAARRVRRRARPRLYVLSAVPRKRLDAMPIT
jgi:hypothetical protein